MTPVPHPAEILRNESAFEELANRIGRDDRESSSHWRQMHEQFRYEDGRLVAAQGFGAWIPPYRGLRRLVHHLLLSRYRRYGERIHAFPRIDQLAAEVTARQNRAYNLDVIRQALTCSFLINTVPQRIDGPDPILIVGMAMALLPRFFLQPPGMPGLCLSIFHKRCWLISPA
jgi:hypothetical protein